MNSWGRWVIGGAYVALLVVLFSAPLTEDWRKMRRRRRAWKNWVGGRWKRDQE